MTKNINKYVINQLYYGFLNPKGAVLEPDDFFEKLKKLDPKQKLSQNYQKKLGFTLLQINWLACSVPTYGMRSTGLIQQSILKKLNTGFLPSYLGRYPKTKLLQDIRNFNQKCLGKTHDYSEYEKDFFALQENYKIIPWHSHIKLFLGSISWRGVWHGFLKITLKILDIVDNTLDWIIVALVMIINCVFFYFIFSVLAGTKLFKFINWDSPILAMSSNQFTPLIGLGVFFPAILLFVFVNLNKFVHFVFCSYELWLMEKSVIPMVSYEVRKINNRETALELIFGGKDKNTGQEKPSMFGFFGVIFSTGSQALNSEIKKNLK